MQRELTYEAVLSYPGHPSADDVYRVISSRYSTISKATVYRNLAALSEDGRIGRVESFANGEVHYDHRTEEHCHGYCMRCGRVVDIAIPYDNRLNIEAEPMEDGFSITSHKLIFEGICSECRKKGERKWN